MRVALLLLRPLVTFSLQVHEGRRYTRPMIRAELHQERIASGNSLDGVRLESLASSFQEASLVREYRSKQSGWGERMKSFAEFVRAWRGFVLLIMLLTACVSIAHAASIRAGVHVGEAAHPLLAFGARSPVQCVSAAVADADDGELACVEVEDGDDQLEIALPVDPLSVDRRSVDSSLLGSFRFDVGVASMVLGAGLPRAPPALSA